MPEVSTHAFNPNFDNELDIESIISAPLVAASKANVIMVTGQTRFLLEYCFKKNDNNNTYEPVMIQMSMTKGIIDNTKDPSDPTYIKKIQMTFAVPLLCLVPINSLAVEKVTLDFDLEITSVIPKPSKPANESNQKVTDDRAQLNGKISYDSNQKSGDDNANKSQLSSKLKVSINAGPLPLPVGVLALLDLYTKAIQPTPADDTAEKPTINKIE
jgi:hypothetical protein